MNPRESTMNSSGVPEFIESSNTDATANGPVKCICDTLHSESRPSDRGNSKPLETNRVNKNEFSSATVTLASTNSVESKSSVPDSSSETGISNAFTSERHGSTNNQLTTLTNQKIQTSNPQVPQCCCPHPPPSKHQSSSLTTRSDDSRLQSSTTSTVPTNRNCSFNSTSSSCSMPANQQVQGSNQSNQFQLNYPYMQCDPFFYSTNSFNATMYNASANRLPFNPYTSIYHPVPIVWNQNPYVSNQIGASHQNVPSQNSSPFSHHYLTFPAPINTWETPYLVVDDRGCALIKPSNFNNVGGQVGSIPHCASMPPVHEKSLSTNSNTRHSNYSLRNNSNNASKHNQRQHSTNSSRAARTHPANAQYSTNRISENSTLMASNFSKQCTVEACSEQRQNTSRTVPNCHIAEKSVQVSLEPSNTLKCQCRCSNTFCSVPLKREQTSMSPVLTEDNSLANLGLNSISISTASVNGYCSADNEGACRSNSDNDEATLLSGKECFTRRSSCTNSSTTSHRDSPVIGNASATLQPSHSHCGMPTLKQNQFVDPLMTKCQSPVQSGNTQSILINRNVDVNLKTSTFSNGRSWASLFKNNNDLNISQKSNSNNSSHEILKPSSNIDVAKQPSKPKTQNNSSTCSQTTSNDVIDSLEQSDDSNSATSRSEACNHNPNDTNCNDGDAQAELLTSKKQTVHAPSTKQNEETKDMWDLDFLRFCSFISNFQRKQSAPALTPRGFLNTHNYCYANCIMQSLLACPLFYNFVDSLPSLNLTSMSLDKPLQNVQEFIDVPLADATTNNEKPTATSNGNYCKQKLRKFIADQNLVAPVYLSSIKQLFQCFQPMIRSGIVWDSRSSQNPNGTQGRLSLRDLQIGDALNISWIHRLVDKLMNKTLMGCQEDAHEFLCRLLQRLNTECAACLKVNENFSIASNSSTVINGIQPENLEADLKTQGDQHDQSISKNAAGNSEEWQEYYGRKIHLHREVSTEKSPISEVFGGCLRTNLERILPNGSTINSSNMEPFFSLSIDVECPSIVQSLRDMAARSAVFGLHDSTTSKPVKGFQTMLIERLPPCLILHLKCFSWKDGMKKVAPKQVIPVELTFPVEIMSKTSTSRRQYILFAIIHHCGRSNTSGHYLCDVFHPGLPGWVRCDDKVVKPIHSREVLISASGNGAGVRNCYMQNDLTPYILFYRQQDHCATPSRK